MLRSTLVYFCFLVLGSGTECFGNSWTLPLFGRHGELSEPVMEPTQWQIRQRFLLDLLLQVHKPLLNEKLIYLGSQLNEDPREYEEGSWRHLQDFLELVRQNKVARPFSIFTPLDEAMPQSLLGAYRFLLLAKDWTSFQRNACYARIHFHPVLFVNALQMAVSEREDTKDLRLPAMYEVLPQLYFEKEVILAAQEVAWYQLTPIRMVTPKRRWKDILLRNLSIRWEGEPMSTDPLVIDNGREMAHLSFDLELNSHWNSLINRLVLSNEKEKQGAKDNLIIDGDRLVSFRGPRDEVNYRNHLLMGSHLGDSQVFLFSLQQFMAALSMEDLVTGHRSTDLVDSPMMTTGGVPYRSTSLDIDAVGRILDLTIQDLKNQIVEALQHNGSSTEDALVASRVISGNYLNTCRQLNLAINGYRNNQPSMMDSPTANLRDPIYRWLLHRLNELINKNKDHLLPKNEFGTPKIMDIQVGRLVTFEETVDTDLINLIDQQLLQSQRNNLQFLRRHLVARQRRLNHESFNISLEITAPADMTVQIRMYLRLPNQKGTLLYIDTSVCSLSKGTNRIERHFPSALTRSTLSQLYEANYQTTYANDSSIRFPAHLLLPRGSIEGLNIQLHVELASWTGWEQEFGGMSAPVLSRSLKDVLIFHHQAQNY
ncbi:hypothetical protein KR009_007634 [Drosophila setifemur]|nr:hypothetical protein KR009_007634 [Drosophila setifemur]